MTLTAGVSLILALRQPLVVRRRFRSAVIFAAVAMVTVAPRFGWSLAHANNGYLASNILASNILTGLAASEKLVVLGRNLMSLLGSPFSLLTGLITPLRGVSRSGAELESFYVRRQLVPNLFIALYWLRSSAGPGLPERFCGADSAAGSLDGVAYSDSWSFGRRWRRLSLSVVCSLCGRMRSAYRRRAQTDIFKSPDRLSTTGCRLKLFSFLSVRIRRQTAFFSRTWTACFYH